MALSETKTIRPMRGDRTRHAAILLLLITGLVLALPTTASARDSAARKFGRGASNLTLGVLAIPGQMVRTTQDSGVFVGATWGFVKGVSFMVASEVVGLFELVTCPFETPPEFKPILKPEFPWQYFTQSASAD